MAVLVMQQRQVKTLMQVVLAVDSLVVQAMLKQVLSHSMLED